MSYLNETNDIMVIKGIFSTSHVFWLHSNITEYLKR